MVVVVVDAMGAVVPNVVAPPTGKVEAARGAVAPSPRNGKILLLKNPPLNELIGAPIGAALVPIFTN